jgi:hypothetical protein
MTKTEDTLRRARARRRATHAGVQDGAFEEMFIPGFQWVRRLVLRFTAHGNDALSFRHSSATTLESRAV